MRVVYLEYCRLRTGPCPRKSELFLGWVNCHHCGGCTASNNLFCESAVTTPDIKPSKSLWQVEPVEKRFANTTAPTAHHSLIGLTVREKFVSTVHDDPLSLAVYE